MFWSAVFRCASDGRLKRACAFLIKEFGMIIAGSNITLETGSCWSHRPKPTLSSTMLRSMANTGWPVDPN